MIERSKLRDWESYVADEHAAREEIKVKETQEYKIQQNSIKYLNKKYFKK